MEDEWTTVISGDRLVKFTYLDLPEGRAFLTAQIAVMTSSTQSLCNKRNTHSIAKALNVTSTMSFRSVPGVVNPASYRRTGDGRRGDHPDHRRHVRPSAALPSARRALPDRGKYFETIAGGTALGQRGGQRCSGDGNYDRRATSSRKDLPYDLVVVKGLRLGSRFHQVDHDDAIPGTQPPGPNDHHSGKRRWITDCPDARRTVAAVRSEVLPPLEHARQGLTLRGA